jgi:hypothetical protein
MSVFIMNLNLNRGMLGDHRKHKENFEIFCFHPQNVKNLKILGHFHATITLYHRELYDNKESKTFEDSWASSNFLLADILKVIAGLCFTSPKLELIWQLTQVALRSHPKLKDHYTWGKL